MDLFKIQLSLLLPHSIVLLMGISSLLVTENVAEHLPEGQMLMHVSGNVSDHIRLEDARYCWNRGRLLNESMFHSDTCVMCYFYIPDDYFNYKKLSYSYKYPGCLHDNWNGQRYCYDNGDDIKKISDTFSNTKGIQLWKNCCEAAVQCCDIMTSNKRSVEIDGPHCKRQWDGWSCIDDTPAGETAFVPCPTYIYFYGDPPIEGCQNDGGKKCFDNGTWMEKTDYVPCGKMTAIQRRIYTNIAAFAFSVVFLIPAIIIFLSYKQLRVPRITMHTNLFISLMVNGIVVIIYKCTIVLNALGVVSTNSAGCKFALAITKYTRMTTYMWMFCEGFYLHKLIVTAFAEEKRLAVYYFIGWVFPVLPVTIYSTLRKLLADESCWMTQAGGYEWLINAPMLISLALNLTFLCNIIRVLITKLQANHSNEPRQFRIAVRATVVLVPLFGLHLLFVMYLPNHGACGAIEFYYYFSSFTDGIQGFIVSLLFCYFNGEVRNLLKRSYNRIRLMQDPRGIYSLHSRASATSTQNVSLTEMTSVPPVQIKSSTS